MTLRVHHYYPHGTGNSGDELVARALRQALVQHLGPCAFTTVPATERGARAGMALGLCLENVRRANAEADLVVVGGSNMLEPRKARGPADNNIPLAIDPAALDQLTTPLVLSGMGTGSSFGKPIRRYAAGAAANLRQLFALARTHAVRDATTVRELERIGIGTTCTGCPVTFLTDRDVAAQESRLPLMVSLPPGRILSRFLGGLFMRLALRYVDWLRYEGIPFVVSLHEASDRDVAARLLPADVPVFYTEDVDALVDRFEESRGVIGFRLHAALLGLGLGKPIVPVGVDWRGLAFIETVDGQDVSIRPFRLGQLSKLKRLTRLLLDSDAAFLGRWADAKRGLQKRHEEFWRRCAVGIRLPARAG